MIEAINYIERKYGRKKKKKKKSIKSLPHPPLAPQRHTCGGKVNYRWSNYPEGGHTYCTKCGKKVEYMPGHEYAETVP